MSKQQEQESRYALDLLRMVAPERAAELQELQQQYAPSFFTAGDSTRFVMQASPSFGFVQYSNRTLLQVWLLSWVIMWKEMYCWSTFIWEFSKQGNPFVLSELEAIPGQNEIYTEADALYAQAISFARSEPMDWTLWLPSVPKPLEIALLSEEDWLIKDLVHHAVAFFLLHEVRHITLPRDGRTFSDQFEEEFECDRWATEYLLARSDTYAQSSGEDPQKIRSKRAMGIALGKAVIAHIQELGLWDPGEDHPPIAARMSRLAEGVDLPSNDLFWNVACNFLLASLRRQCALPDCVEFKDERDLFTKLLVRG